MRDERRLVAARPVDAREILTGSERVANSCAPGAYASVSAIDLARSGAMEYLPVFTDI